MRYNNILIIAKRELSTFFSTPIAYISLISYIVLSNIFMFYIGSFFQKGQADLSSFFVFQPWIFLLFISSITMRMWSEEKKSGTIELLTTLPFLDIEIVLGKFAGAVSFVVFAIFLTFPLWISVNILGDPDNMIIMASYLGNILTAILFVSIGLCVSSLTKNQIVAFISSIMIFFIYLFSGTNVILDFFNQSFPMLASAISTMSVLSHFDTFLQGLVEIKSILYFIFGTTFWIYINYYIIKYKRG
jgi:ABC-2 type transport system permease protein